MEIVTAFLLYLPNIMHLFLMDEVNKRHVLFVNTLDFHSTEFWIEKNEDKIA